MPLGPWELGIILVIVILIFGAGKLSEVGSALGKSVREFKSSATDGAEAPADGKPASAETAS